MSRKRHHQHRHRQRTPEEELHHFLRQPGISARNIERIRTLTRHSKPEVRSMAEVVLEIARVKPGRRRRLQVITREHPDLFIDMVAVLGDYISDEYFGRMSGEPEWLWACWERANWQVRFNKHGRSPCWCGSGTAYWDCCAERDEEIGAQLAAEAQALEWEMHPERIPWWHPDSGISHETRSAYEMYSIDSSHPFALPPPECR